MTQWGSKYLGAQGRTPYEILTNFYGSDIELVTASEVEGIPESYPGFNLTIGSSGPPVRTIQEQLNRIADNYPLIPKVAADGVFGEGVAEAVRVFQQVLIYLKPELLIMLLGMKFQIYMLCDENSRTKGDKNYRKNIHSSKIL